MIRRSEELERWCEAQEERARAAEVRRRQWDADHPVRVDLYPLAERFHRAKMQIGQLRERAYLDPCDVLPLLQATAEAAQAQALAELQAAAEAGDTPGIRVPLTLPDCGWYMTITTSGA